MKHRIAMQGESFSSNEFVGRREKSWDLHPFFSSSFCFLLSFFLTLCTNLSANKHREVETQNLNPKRKSWGTASSFRDSTFYAIFFLIFFYFIFPVEDDNGCCFYVRYCKIKLRFFSREILTFLISSVEN